MIIRIFVALLIFSTSLNSQTNTEAGLKDQLHLYLGGEYRITPIHGMTDSNRTDASFFTNMDRQNSGLGLVAGAEYFLFEKISAGLTGSIRYDDIIFKPPTDIRDFSQDVEQKNMLFGYHLDINYHFKLFKRGCSFISAGYSLLNRNSDYNTQRIFYNGQGDIIERQDVSGDYKYSAIKLSLGYRLNRSKFSLGIYSTRRTPYYEGSNSFIVPHVNYKYSISLLSKSF